MKRDTQQNTAISDAMKRQRSYFAAGGTREVAWRVASLRRLEGRLVERREEMCAALESDLGKPEIEAFLAEYHFLLEEIRLVCQHLKRWLQPRKVGAPFYFLPSLNRILRRPFGVTVRLCVLHGEHRGGSSGGREGGEALDALRA
jgi:aldehyde dehydrogenase (NAD+)